MSHDLSSRSMGNTPKIIIRDATSDFVKFTLSNTCLSVANAVRRVAIAEVPTVAIDLVEIVENSSVLCDEFIAHRLGLVPLVSDSASDYMLPSEYVGEDEAKINVHLNLAVKCSSDHTLRCHHKSFNLRRRKIFTDSDSNKQEPPGVLIELVVKCIARKGIGKDHAKWSPVATAVYKCEPELYLNEELTNKLTDREKLELVNSCPIPILRLNQHTKSLEIERNDSYAYDDECIKKAEEFGKGKIVEIKAKEDTFNFFLEGTGVLRPGRIVLHTFKILLSKLDSIKQILCCCGQNLHISTTKRKSF
ncbi:unnamed protein product [Bathycoccus prasinos]